MTSLIAAYYAAIFALITSATCTIPDYIHVCHHDNPDLAGCIKSSIEALRPRLEAGIPELEVPGIEPLDLDKITLESRTQATSLATNLTNIRVWGASKFQILKLTPKTVKDGHIFRFEVKIPELFIRGDYEVNSRVLLLELRGKGPFHANISDFHFECLAKAHKIQVEGNVYLKFDKFKCNVVVGKTHIVLENLFNGNPIISQATNDAINDNSEAFFEEIKPSVLNAVVSKFTDVANKITLHFKYDELFP